MGRAPSAVGKYKFCVFVKDVVNPAVPGLSVLNVSGKRDIL